MVHVIATIKLISGRRDDFVVRFKELVPLVLQETGCVEYFPALDLDTKIDIQQTDENSLVVIERWESVEALEAHLGAPHMTTFREDTSDAVESVGIRIVTSEI